MTDGLKIEFEPGGIKTTRRGLKKKTEEYNRAIASALEEVALALIFKTSTEGYIPEWTGALMNTGHFREHETPQFLGFEVEYGAYQVPHPHSVKAGVPPPHPSPSGDSIPKYVDYAYHVHEHGSPKGAGKQFLLLAAKDMAKDIAPMMRAHVKRKMK